MYHFKPFIPAMVCLLGITGLSVMPSVSLPEFNLIGPDKLGHAFIYAVLTWFMLRGFSKQGNGSMLPKERWFAFLFSAGWGALMEWVQFAFVPGRMCEFDDMIANATGAGLMSLGYWAARR